MKDIPSLIRNSRRRQNIDAGDCARWASLSLSHFQRIEKGECGATTYTLKQIEKALGEPGLLTGPEEPNIDPYWINELLCEAARVYTLLSKDQRVNLGRALLNCSPALFKEACAAIASREQHQAPVLNRIVTTGKVASCS